MSELRTNRIVPRDGLASGSSGGIIQIKQTVLTEYKTFSDTSYVDIDGLSVSITPTRSDSKIMVMVNFNASIGTADRWYIFQLVRGSTAICVGDAASSRSVGSVGGVRVNTGNSSDGNNVEHYSINFLDSPSTTSSTTYKIQGKCQSGATGVINRSGTDSNADYGLRLASTITAMEVSG